MQWNVTILDEFAVATKEVLTVLQNSVRPDGSVVVGLHGDLGAGKTTMTQIIAQELGVVDTVQSPTFVIRKSYNTSSETFKKLIHIDAYRLGEDENLSVLKFDEDFNSPNTLVIIEWPEMIEKILPEQMAHVYIEHTHEGREIRLTNKKTA